MQDLDARLAQYWRHGILPAVKRCHPMVAPFTPDAQVLEGCVDWAAAYHLPCRPSTFSRTGMLCCHLPLPNLLLAMNMSRRLALLEQRIYMTKLCYLTRRQAAHSIGPSYIRSNNLRSRHRSWCLRCICVPGVHEEPRTALLVTALRVVASRAA